MTGSAENRPGHWHDAGAVIICYLTRQFPGLSDEFRNEPMSFPVQPVRCFLIPALLALVLLAAGVVEGQQQPGGADRLQQRVGEYQRPVVIQFEGMIDGQNAGYFRNRLERARSRGADLVIVEIDSPGGYAFDSLAIAESLRDVDWAYTVAWIPREAISGAALVSLGCDEIIMGSHARFGDAGPIHFDPQVAAFRYVPAKAKSVLVRQARDLAVAKGKPPELAEAMVDENAVVFRRIGEPQGDPAGPRFRVVQISEDEDDPLAEARRQGLELNEWELVPESGKGRILTVNGPTAVELGIANALADDRMALLDELNATSPPVVFRRNVTDHVVDWLTHPVITVLLIVVGLIALYLELSAPGIGAGGLIAGLCAILFFWSRFFGGTAGWLEVILFLAGLTFLMMEVFVIPGFGIAGITGMGLLLASVVMASQDFVWPETPGQWNQVLKSLLVVFVALTVFAVGTALLSRKIGSLPVLGRIALKPPAAEPVDVIDKETGKPRPLVHPLVSVGDWGNAESLLRPAGRARFGHRSIDVVSDGSFINPGAQVRVIEISGNRIVVAEVEESDEEPSIQVRRASE